MYIFNYGFLCIFHHPNRENPANGVLADVFAHSLFRFFPVPVAVDVLHHVRLPR